MRRLIALLLPGLLLLAACLPSGPTLQQQIQLAVAATLSNLPRPTAAPPPTPQPTFTPVPLVGVFCEYQFCIGHPTDMAFYDASAAQNQLSPSTYSQGILAAYTSKLFIQMLWQEAPGVTDPQFMLDLILQYGSDSRNGSIEPQIFGPLNVFYVPIIPAPGSASTLPYGAAAAWTCGGRAFAWKVYTLQPDLTAPLLTDALSRFRCQPR